MHGFRTAARAGAAILVAMGALSAPAGAQGQGQGPNRGINVNPSQPAEPPVRIVEWVNQSFTVPDSIA